MTGGSELSVVSDFIDVLESLDIRYAIGGSIASSVYEEGSCGILMA